MSGWRRLLVPAWLLALGGCAGDVRTIELKLMDAERAYEAGNYVTAASAVNQFLASNPEPEDRAAALYLRALVHVRAGRRAAAYEDARAATALAKRADTRWRACFVLGTLHFEDGDWSLAARAYDDAIRGGPAAAPLDVARFRRAQCAERLGRWSESWSLFGEMARQHPTSELAAAARRRASLQAGHFAIQCGVFTQPANAESLMTALRQGGFQPYRTVERRGSGQAHIVMVGRFTRFEEAEHALRNVARVVNQPVIWP